MRVVHAAVVAAIACAAGVERSRFVLAAGVVLAAPLSGCGQTWQPPAVGTCIRASSTGDVVVPCAAAHTHRVAAVVAGDGDDCPPETVMYSTPADPDVEPQVTVCYVRDAGGR